MNQPALTQDQLPSFSSIHPENIESELTAILDRNRSRLQTILAPETPHTWQSLMQPLEDIHDELGKYWAPISHMHSVMETESLRHVYNKALALLTEYQTEISQNETLFAAILALSQSDAFASLSPAQRKIIENDIRDFKLAGIHLPAENKLRVATLQKELSQLMTKFSENILDATQAYILQVTDAKQLTGLPASAIQLAAENAQKRELEGYVITLDYPAYSTAMKFLMDRELRQKLYFAYATRASELGPNAGKWDNTEVMENILRVRHEMAQLIGFQNYAAYSLATKMAKTSDDVLRFLNDLLTRSKPIAEVEFLDIMQLAAKDGIEKLEAWDVSYYSERLREKTFDFSQEDLRVYFPIDHVLNGMFTLVNKVYGLTIHADEVEVWHPDVKFFSIYDEKNNLRGGFYIDLYAREHKRDGAWMDEARTRRTKNGMVTQYPIAFLTCNFMRPVEDRPALLTHDDVLTLFHEFGHSLHHMLTKVDYPSVSGINGVPWDAVEFPSQFMENYVWEKASLDLIAQHYETHAPLPDELYNKMIAAKYFQTGLHMMRQLEFALFDFKLHLEFDPTIPSQIQTTIDEVRKQTTLVPVPSFNRFQNSFSHIFAGSYAAGYYSYKWAEVLSSDAYEQFIENGIFDRATGKAFMENILEIGGVRDPLISFIAFRGREPKIDALLRLNGIIKSNAA